MTDTQPANAQRHEITFKRAVLTLPEMNEVEVRRDVPFAAADDGDPLALDVYLPKKRAAKGRQPAVLLVAGYPGVGFRRMLGCSFRELGSTDSWARLFAASGVAAIAADNRDPLADLAQLFVHLRRDGAELGIDPSQLGVFASSGNGPLGLSTVLTSATHAVRCAAFVCPLLMDLDGATNVAGAATQWRFSNATAGHTIEDVRTDVPIFIARGGQDQFPEINPSIDAFIAAALRRNLPISLVNHPRGPHAFDVFDDSTSSKAIIRQVLAFMAEHLAAQS